MQTVFNIFVFALIYTSGQCYSCPTRQWLQDYFNRTYVPGAAIIVINSTHTLYEETFGFHSILSRQFVDLEKSIFGLASISKTFIAVSVMQLVEKGMVDLDADINQYLLEHNHRYFYHPNYTTHAITLRRLLSHTSSIAVDESIQLSLYQTGDTALEKSTLEDTLFTYITPNASSWIPKAPGTVAYYSNYGSSLAAFVVERVANLSFDQYVKEKIMKPLGVDISRVGVRIADFANKEELVEHFAYLFSESDYNEWMQGMPQLQAIKLENRFPTWLFIPWFGFSGYPAGLFRMPARSVAKFLQMFMNNGSPLLSPKSIAEMKMVVGGGLIPYFDSDGMASASGSPIPNFGLSWTWQRLRDGHQYIGHSGSFPGSRHWMLINEENTIGVIVLTNGDSNVPKGRSKQYYDLLEDVHLSFFKCFKKNLVS